MGIAEEEIKGVFVGILQRIYAKFAIFGIALLCFGYFAAYIPYSMLTKMGTSGLFAGMERREYGAWTGSLGVGAAPLFTQTKGSFNGVHIQPVAILASTLGMFAFLTLAGWWRYATHSTIFGVSIPRAKWYTCLSGLCTGGVIVTTTLAYTFSGISIVFAMLLMRGGVLVIAPIVDLIAIKRRRKIYWPSWVAALLSLGALLVAFLGDSSMAMKITATVDIALYLGCYFLRFLVMSNYAKSPDMEEKKRYFTEEQLVANSVLFTVILLYALSGAILEYQVYEFNNRIQAPEVRLVHADGKDIVLPIGVAVKLAKQKKMNLAQVSTSEVPECRMLPKSVRRDLWYGVSRLPFTGYFWHIFLLGFMSYGTGLFGSLIFLDRREHTFTAPANRASSIVAGVIATYLLAIFYAQKYPDKYEWLGVVLIIGAIFFLACHSFVEKKRRGAMKIGETICRKFS